MSLRNEVKYTFKLHTVESAVKPSYFTFYFKYVETKLKHSLVVHAQGAKMELSSNSTNSILIIYSFTNNT